MSGLMRFRFGLSRMHYPDALILTLKHDPVINVIRIKTRDLEARMKELKFIENKFTTFSRCKSNILTVNII